MHNREYLFQWRRLGWFSNWKRTSVIGHNLNKDDNKMVLYFSDGGLAEIAKWNECEVRLGVDWVVAQQEHINQEAGQKISQLNN